MQDAEYKNCTSYIYFGCLAQGKPINGHEKKGKMKSQELYGGCLDQINV